VHGPSMKSPCTDWKTHVPQRAAYPRSWIQDPRSARIATRSGLGPPSGRT
jgi:hypothetical protein